MTGMAVRERPSPNHDSRGEAPNLRPVDMLVLHYTGMTSGAAAIDRLCDPEARVSAHYVVEEDGTVWRLVPEERRAFHAGVSCWDGEQNLNRLSIGVEIVNPGHEWGYRPFPEAQMMAVERLCREVLSRHPIPPYRVVGHSDIAPDRKSDPGELFDWPGLAAAGIGLWPDPGADHGNDVLVLEQAGVAVPLRAHDVRARPLQEESGLPDSRLHRDASRLPHRGRPQPLLADLWCARVRAVPQSRG